MRIWRISNFADLSGRGAMLVDGRWHRRDTPVVYCADHPSTSLLEILVHATRQTVPNDFQLLEIEVPDDVQSEEPAIEQDKLADLDFTRRTGTIFLTSNRYALLKVPSIIMPKASNYLLNPRHPDSERVEIFATYRYPFDSRLLR
jgi:RES domain-containing protein